jgi:hypothetical protein
MNIQDLIDQAIAEKEERTVTSWQASKVGGCLSGVYFERLGIPPLEELDAITKRKFKCGDLFEQFVVEQIAKTGTPHETQVRVEDKTLGVTGYADVVIEGKEVIEVKSQHSRSFWYMVKKGEGAYEHHMMQLFLYMHILGKDFGRLTYVSKDDLCIQEYPFEKGCKKYDEVMEKALSNIALLNEALKTGTPPPAAEEGTFQAKYCKWHKYCVGELPVPTV